MTLTKAIEASSEEGSPAQFSGPLVTRRHVLIGGAAIAAYKIASRFGFKVDLSGLYNGAQFEAGRRPPNDREVYYPPNPEELLPRGVTDEIFDHLELGSKYPRTLNKDAFHAVSQRISRLANWYFRPRESDNQELKEKAFYKYNEKFFQRLLGYSDAMGVDFVATMLMWQVSGASTSSMKAYQQDIRDERLRMGIAMTDDVLGQSGGTVAINLIRAVSGLTGAESLNSAYYALPRIDAMVTLGIHDVETIIVCRSLADLRKTKPEEWLGFVGYLQQRAPGFLSRMDGYIADCDRFEQVSTKIASEVRSSTEVRDYLNQFLKPWELEGFLTKGGRVDDYQFQRTTRFWANVSGLSQTILMGAYESDPKVMEDLALKRTVDYYRGSGDVAGFFLDQILNPRMTEKLKADADGGNAVAKRLLELGGSVQEASDKVMTGDMLMAKELVDGKKELDGEFQLFTGVAITRWMLSEAYRHTHNGQSPKEIRFENPDEIAYHAFLGTAIRESSPTYQLTGARPLARATSTFIPPEEIFGTFDGFVDQVYSKFEPAHPARDFKTFAKYWLKLIEERYFPSALGVPRYKIDRDQTMAKFIQDAGKSGAYENLITPPHCSWIRTPEAVMAYIANMGS